MNQPADAAEVITQVLPGAEGNILQITINRAAVHNCVNGAAAAQLLAAWQRFQADDSLLVAVLHGAGDKSFCSGADLTALDQLSTLGEQTASRGELEQQGAGPMGGTRLVQVKPVITMAQGYAYAGGLELFCHGHIRIAEPQATFSVACRRWGGAARRRRHRVSAAAVGLGKRPAADHHWRAHLGPACARDRPGLGSRARREWPGASARHCRANLSAAARRDAGRPRLGHQWAVPLDGRRARRRSSQHVPSDAQRKHRARAGPLRPRRAVLV